LVWVFVLILYAKNMPNGLQEKKINKLFWKTDKMYKKINELEKQIILLSLDIVSIKKKI